MEHESLHEDIIVEDECDQSFMILKDNQSISNFGEGDQSNLISEISFNEDSILDDVSDILGDTLEDEANIDYPNEAYGDLMALVMKHKLNNTTSNAIIKFLINMQILLHLLFQSLSNKNTIIWII